MHSNVRSGRDDPADISRDGVRDEDRNAVLEVCSCIEVIDVY